MGGLRKACRRRRAARTRLPARRPRLDRYPCHAADRRHRLAAEAECTDAKQIVGILEFAGRMAGEDKRQVVRLDPVAIVNDADQLGAALFEVDVDPRRPGIDGVFQQLLDDASGPLDHLAGGDLGDNGCG